MADGRKNVKVRDTGMRHKRTVGGMNADRRCCGNMVFCPGRSQREGNTSPTRRPLRRISGFRITVT